MVDSHMDTLMGQSFIFHLSNTLWKQMRNHAIKGAPREVCGLIAGRMKDDSYQALKIIPITNILHSPNRYRMDPEEQILAFNEIESMGVELIGIYHSHPHGPEYPSERDINESFYPECANLIWSRSESSWSCRGYFIKNRNFSEVQILLNTNS